MNKFRVGNTRHVRIYVKEEGREILRRMGTAEYNELNEDGLEPDVGLVHTG